MAGMPMEPRADLRTLANELRQLYVALVDKDFSASEALAIIGHVIAANKPGEDQ